MSDEVDAREALPQPSLSGRSREASPRVTGARREKRATSGAALYFQNNGVRKTTAKQRATRAPARVTTANGATAIVNTNTRPASASSSSLEASTTRPGGGGNSPQASEQPLDTQTGLAS